MKNNNRIIKIISGILSITLTSCNNAFYKGELITKNTNEIISYINEYRINSSLKYLIPLESTSSISKNDIKSLKLDNTNIENYDLERINESDYKYYLKIDSSKSYNKMNIVLNNNQEYVYYLNLINYNKEQFNNDYTFKLIDFSYYEESIYNYKLSYLLNFKDDISLILDNELNINHPLFKGTATLINMDKGKESYSSRKEASLDKNTNYLLTLSFKEDYSTYYFDEFIPFKIEIEENSSFKSYYIIPQIEDSFTSKILKNIF